MKTKRMKDIGLEKQQRESVTKEKPIQTKTIFINKAQVKKFALEVAKNRYHKFTRVSNEFLVDVDSKIRGIIINHVNSLPSVGKTI